MWRDLFIVYIILNSYGFPGRYQSVFGHSMRTLLDYGAFFLQIAMMLLSSSDKVTDIKLIDFKKKYTGIYLAVTVIGVVSMAAARNKSLEAVSVVRLSTTALFAIWLCENYRPRRVLEFAYYAQILFIIASLVFITVFRSYYIRGSSYQNDYVGLYGVKNEAASQLSFSLLLQMALLKLVKEDGEGIADIPFFWPVLITQIILLFSSHGVGGLFFAGVPILYIFFSGTLIDKKDRLQIGPIYLAGSIGFLFIAMTVIPFFKPVFDLLGKDITLTGRTLLWEQIIEVMTKHKTLTGYGYGMFWRDPQAVKLVHAGFDEYSFMGNMTSGGHNTILELWLNCGLLGVASIFGMVLYAFRAPNRIPYDAYIMSSSYMLWYMMHGWMERASGNYEYNIIFLYLAAAYACNKTIPPKRVSVSCVLPAADIGTEGIANG